MYKYNPANVKELFDAISRKSYDDVKILLLNGIDPNGYIDNYPYDNKILQPYAHVYPLQRAIEFNCDIRIIMMLLDCGAYTGVTNILDETLEMIAIRKKNNNVLDVLLDHKRDLCQIYLLDLMYETMYNDNPDIIYTLFKYGAGVHIRVNDSADSTLLHVAAESGHLDVVKALIACGADPFLRNNEGLMPYEAAYAYHSEVGKWLESAMREYVV